MSTLIKYAKGIKNNADIQIAIGNSRKAKEWKNKKWAWSFLVEKLSTPTITPETMADYKKMTKEEKGKVKDVGGFVGGTLKEGKRNNASVQSRTLLTLDIDYGRANLWEDMELIYDFAMCMYPTHSYTDELPKYRIIIPLSRPVLPDEYQALGRIVANELVMDLFDDTTYEPARLMFFPSCSSDFDYDSKFRFQDATFLNVDEWLDKYTFGWQDTSYWPESSRARAKLRKTLDKQEDPLFKSGVIGAFCRAYTIQEAIDEFLEDVYIPGADDTRYTYAEGSTTGGLVIYDDKFAYSHHGTDPSGGMLCNAYDLVRVHKFVDEDDEKENNSMQRMNEFALKQDKVKLQLMEDRKKEASEDFDEVEVDNDRWKLKLDVNEKTGAIRATINNIVIILENDSNLKGKLQYDENVMRNAIVGELPWRRKEEDVEYWEDRDESNLKLYLENEYGLIRCTNMILDALNVVFNKNRVHPVRSYINSLEWDGVKRLDNIWNKYFDIEESIYTKACARVMMCGAVARILKPGIQFDLVPVLVGEQGIGKGTFFRTLAKSDRWYEELTNIDPKYSTENTMGKWIVEMPELSATAKANQEELKAFITNKSRTQRLAYARNSTTIDRQFILVGSTNRAEFLKDSTGNRRFLPLQCPRKANDPKEEIFEELPLELDQLWAEAKEVYQEMGAKALILNKEELKEADVVRNNFRDTDIEEAKVIEFLNTKLPKDWYDRSLQDRMLYFAGDFVSEEPKDGFYRDRICTKELLAECYGKTGIIEAKESYRFRNILESIPGWSKCKSTIRIKGYGTQRGFVRDDMYTD